MRVEFGFGIVLLFSLACQEGLAQNDDCELTINRAQEEFNTGHFYAIPEVLSPCINQFSSEQRQRVYLLLTQTYLLLDDPINARESYLKVLKANPEFLTDTALHPIDVIYLSKKFTSTPIFSWFAKAGSNGSFIRTIHQQSTIGEQSAGSKYLLRPGYQAMAGLDFNFTSKLNLRGEFVFSMLTYSNEASGFFIEDTKLFTEKQSWISVPISVVYSDNLGKFRPYGYFGYSINYLLADKGNVSITNNKPSSNADDIIVRERINDESPDFDLLFKRNKLNQSLFLGGGMKMKVGLDFFFVDIRYAFGMRNVVSDKNVYADYSEADLTSDKFVQSMEISSRYMQSEDYFRIDNLSLSIGFLRPLYKPRELKRARTKSVLKQLTN